jgi:hypothetical protein
MDEEMQNIYLKKSLLQIRWKMSPAYYERFLEGFRNSLESTEKHLERQKVVISDYGAICRRLLFLKIYEQQSTLRKTVQCVPCLQSSSLAAARAAAYNDCLADFLFNEDLEFGCNETSGKLSDVLEVLETMDEEPDVNKTIPKQRYERIYHHLKSEAEPFEPHDVTVGNEKMCLQTITNPDAECAALCRSLLEPELPLLDEQDIEEVLDCWSTEPEDLVMDDQLTVATAALYRVGYLPQGLSAFDDTSCFLSSLMAMEGTR